MSKIYYNITKPGDMLLPVIKSPITRIQISKFAATMNDYHPMYIDENQAKARGYLGTCAHAHLAFAFAEECIQNFAENIRVYETTATFQKLIWPGDMLTAKGIVSNHYEQNGEHRIDIDLWVENQNQDTVLKGKSTCILFKNKNQEKILGTKLPALSKSSIASA